MVWNGELVNKSAPEDMGVLQTLSHIADPLHYGYFAGLWSKAIWFIFGLFLTAMPIGGYVMWYLRVFKAAKRRRENEFIVQEAK